MTRYLSASRDLINETCVEISFGEPVATLSILTATMELVMLTDNCKFPMLLVRRLTVQSYGELLYSEPIKMNGFRLEWLYMGFRYSFLIIGCWHFSFKLLSPWASQTYYSLSFFFVSKGGRCTGLCYRLEHSPTLLTLNLYAGINQSLVMATVAYSQTQ